MGAAARVDATPTGNPAGFAWVPPTRGQVVSSRLFREQLPGCRRVAGVPQLRAGAPIVCWCVPRQHRALSRATHPREGHPPSRATALAPDAAGAGPMLLGQLQLPFELPFGAPLALGWARAEDDSLGAHDARSACPVSSSEPLQPGPCSVSEYHACTVDLNNSQFPQSLQASSGAAAPAPAAAAPPPAQQDRQAGGAAAATSAQSLLGVGHRIWGSVWDGRGLLQVSAATPAWQGGARPPALRLHLAADGSCGDAAGQPPFPHPAGAHPCPPPCSARRSRFLTWPSTQTWTPLYKTRSARRTRARHSASDACRACGGASGAPQSRGTQQQTSSSRRPPAAQAPSSPLMPVVAASW